MPEPVRVLQILNSLGRGGIENFIMSVYRAVDKSKIQFDFCIMDGKSTEQVEEARALGAEIYVYPPLRLKSFVSYRAWWKEFFRAHPEYRIVHCHTYTTASLFLPYAKKAGCYVIIHSHNTDITARNSLERLIRTALLKPLRSVPWIDARFACSQAAGKWLYGQDAPFQVIYNAMDLKKYAFSESVREEYRRKLGLEHRTVIGHVGNGMEAKNHPFLLKCFAAFHEIRPNAVLLLIGDLYNLEASIADFTREHGLSDSVRVLGIRKDVGELLCAMDAFVFPSLYEGLGIVMIEAQTNGLPCVMSERVPQEADLRAGLVRVEPLAAGSRKWAEAIDSALMESAPLRRSYEKEAAKWGYDIRQAAYSLQSFYLSVF